MTQELLKEYISYDRTTCDMVWIKKTSNLSRVKIGDKVGKSSGNRRYMRAKIFGKEYMLHKLAWLYEYGYIPKELDHINRNSLDNRIDNFREVTTRENLTNRGLMRTNKTTGITGVCIEQGKYIRAYISDGKKQIKLGSFKTLDEAKQARINAEKEYNYLNMEVA